MQAHSGNLVESLYREEWRNVVASLTREFGSHRLDQVENAVQSALLKALDRWRVGPIPQLPAGWVYRVARNSVLDDLRRNQTQTKYARQVHIHFYDDAEAPSNAHEKAGDPLQDDVLGMMFMSSHPSIKMRDKVILMLRAICGFDYAEIGSGLLMTDEAVKKAYGRCKQTIARQQLSLDLPDDADREARLESVLFTIYLMFNEGYFASQGEALLRLDLCKEAERLLALLRSSPLNGDRRIWALSALIAFQSARLPARLAEDGTILTLKEQDRSLWSPADLSSGFDFLERSAGGKTLSRFHLEAAIAACHALAPSYDQTDWERIKGYYADLMAISPSPMITLNHAVAVMEKDGAHAAFPLLEALEASGTVTKSPLLYSVLAECHERLGHTENAAAYFTQAASLSNNAHLAAHWLARS